MSSAKPPRFLPPIDSKLTTRRSRKSTTPIHDSNPFHEIIITDINHEKHYGHWDGTTSNDSISLRDNGDFPLKDIKKIVFKSNITEMKDVTGGKRRKSRNNRKSARKTQRRNYLCICYHQNDKSEMT